MIGGYCRFWNDKEDSNNPHWCDRERRRQAEFLIHQKLSWNFINEVFIMNNNNLEKLKSLFNKFDVNTSISINQEYYY